MRIYVLGATVLMALTSAARSADLGDSVYGAPLAPAAAWSWSGCYAGGDAGGLWSSQQWINQTQGGDFFGLSLGGHDVESFVGGVQAGSDYQFAGGFVIGVQGDYALTNAEGSHASARDRR